MTSTVQLLDGRRVATDSEDWRHQCEAQWILDLRPLEKRRELLAFIERKRGADATNALRDTMQALHQRARAAA